MIRTPRPNAICRPIVPRRAAVELGPGHRGEYDERGCVGEHGRSDRSCHRGVGGEAGVPHRRIHEQRVGREQRSEEQRGRTLPVLREADHCAQRHRNRKRDQSERDDRPAVDAQQREIQLDAGHEHQVEQPELSQLGDSRVAGADQVQSVRPDQEAAQQQPDDARQPGTPQEWRADDHDHEQHEEFPGRSGWGLDRDAGDRERDQVRGRSSGAVQQRDR